MEYEPKTIADQIDCLARLTGAPLSFVNQVRALFSRKGISLEDDASPFLDALEEAFRREESIRCTSDHARRNISKVHDNFQKIGRAYVEQLSQLKKIQSTLREQSQRLRNKQASRSGEAVQVLINGDHRTYVARTEREDLPMVPGPKDPQ